MRVLAPLASHSLVVVGEEGLTLTKEPGQKPQLFLVRLVRCAGQKVIDQSTYLFASGWSPVVWALVPPAA